MATKSFPRLPILLIFILALCLHSTAPGDGDNRSAFPDWWLEQAIHYASTIENADVRSDANYHLAYVLARNGSLSEAADVADKVTKAQRRVYAQTFVAKHYLEQGKEAKYLAEMQRAQQFVLKNENASDNNFINSHLVRSYMKGDRLAEATQLAQNLPDKTQQHLAFVNIAAGLAERGKLTEAYALISDHVRPDWQESVWVRIAYASAGAGRVDDVQTAIERLTEQAQRDNTYKNLVKALLKADRLAKAQEYAAKIVDPVQQATAVGAVKTKLAENDDAMTLASRIAKASTREEKLALYQRLVDHHITEGRVAEAESAIESMIQAIKASPRDPKASKFGISNDDISIAHLKSLYLKTAILLAKQEKKEAGLQRIVWAKKAILNMPEESGIAKGMLMPQLVATQVELGDLPGARDLLEKIESGFSRSDAAQRVAIALIKAKDYSEAAIVADHITYSLGKHLFVGAVAAEWIRAGEFDQARTLLKKLGPSSEEVQAYREVGKTMIELGHGRQLQKWVSEMPSSAASAYACLGAAEGFKKE